MPTDLLTLWPILSTIAVALVGFGTLLQQGRTLKAAHAAGLADIRSAIEDTRQMFLLHTHDEDGGVRVPVAALERTK